MPSKIYIAIMVLALAATLACGDEVTVKGATSGKMTYSNARVTGIQDGQLMLELNGGNYTAKPLENIAKLSITGQDSFNEAEELLAKGKAADAVKAYDLAADRAGDLDWLKQLIVIRRIKALDQSGAIDRAVTEWLALLDQTRNARFAVGLHPTKVAAKGSEANAAAIKALEGTKEQAERESPAASAMRRLLLDLYKAQGDTAKAGAIAAKMGGAGSPVKDRGNSTESGGDTKEPANSGGSLAEALQAAQYQINHDQADLGLKSIESRLQQFTQAELPRALLLMGKAKVAMAKSAAAKEKSKLLVEAGLSFMRVLVFDPPVPEAAEAAYLAGTVNLELNNRVAARAVFGKVSSGYSGSPFAAKAAVEIEKMDKSGPPAKEPAKGNSSKESGSSEESAGKGAGEE